MKYFLLVFSLLVSVSLASQPANPVSTFNCSSIVGVSPMGVGLPLTATASARITGCNFGASQGTVEICNAATHTGTCVAATVTSWSGSGTDITATVNGGSFANGTSVWIYVITSGAVTNARGLGPLPLTVSGSLPPGVTLQAIDGGSTYYASNGFTASTTPMTVNGVTHTQGWDSPTFFPMGAWFTTYDDGVVPNTYATWLDVGLNTVYYYDNINIAQAQARGQSVMWTNGGAAITQNFGNEYKLFMPTDEPGNWSEFNNPIALTTNARQDPRPWYINFTWNMAMHQNAWDGVYNGAPVSTAKGIMSRLITTPNATQRHVNIGGFDVYWFTASPAREGGAEWPFMTGTGGGNEIYHKATALTTDEFERGSNYGDMVDIMRAYQRTNEGGHPAPIIMYLEYGDPWEDAGFCSGNCGGFLSYFIRPHEFHWAWWSMIIHGARGQNIFDHVFNTRLGADCNRCITENPGNFYKTTQAGNTTSHYAQLKADAQLTTGLARIINADHALGYATVSPSGYSCCTPNGGYHTGSDAGYAIVTLTNGIEIASKYYQGGSFTNTYGTFTNGFYIFADVRGSASQTNINATFTIANTGATTVTVVNEARTIPITGGGTTFTDTFATAYTVHIYKIG